MKIQACSINCKRSMYESYRYFSFLNYLYLPVILTKLNEKKKKKLKGFNVILIIIRFHPPQLNQ